MAPEGDIDEVLVVDWRAGTSYVEKLIVPPLPEQHHQSILPFKQKKATPSSNAATKNIMTRMSDATSECTIVVKNESSLKASSGGGGGGDWIAVPEFYDLSDSDGTPIASRRPARSWAEGRAAVVKPASRSLKHTANSGVVVIDSDSDEEAIPKTTLNSSTILEKLRPPNTCGGLQGKVDLQLLKPSEKVDKLRESVSQGVLLEMPISLDEAGTRNSKLAGMVDKLRETVSPGGIVWKDPYTSLDRRRMVDSTSSETDVQIALTAATAYVAGIPLRSEGESQKAGPFTTLGPIVAKPNGINEANVGTCNHYLQTISGSDKLLDRAAEVSKVSSAPAVEAMRNCSLGTGPVCVSEEENRMAYPGQPAFHDLTSDDEGCNSEPEWLRRDDEPIPTRGSRGSSPHKRRDGERPEQFLPNLGGNGGVSDHNEDKKRPLQNVPDYEAHEIGRAQKRRSLPVQATILDLTSDDDDCASEPSWLRDYEPIPIRCSLTSGASLAHDFRGHEQLLPTSIGNNKAGDPIAGRRRPSLQIPGLESPENFGITIAPSVNDIESGEDVPKKKRGTARKGAVSEEELASREAQKQRERELKKARQEEEKRAREEKREELKRQKDEWKRRKEAAKVYAAERKRLEKEDERWRKGKKALENTTVYLDHKLIEMKALGSLIINQLASKNYTYKVKDHTIGQSILWRMKRPSADSQADTEGHGSQADVVTNSQRSNAQLELEEVEMKYVVVVFRGEEFAQLVAEKRHEAHLAAIRKEYPTYSVCYLISGLNRFLKKKEQHQYRTGDQSWTRPNVEQVLAEFITHHVGVNSRLCIDESEIAAHVDGLTRSLAECQFKKKLTSVSVHANGEHVKKGDPNRQIINKSVWLKFLVAIDGVNGAIAIAIAKEYPSMRALLNAYLDPNRAIRDKETLLEDLVKDGSNLKVGSVLSGRIYRILMAKDGSLDAKDVEGGADHFTSDD